MSRLMTIASRNLIQRGWRSLPLGGAIAAVTASLIVAFGIARAIGQDIYDLATTVYSGHVNVHGVYKSSAQLAAPEMLNPEAVEKVIRATLPVEYIAPRVLGWGSISSDSATLMNVTTVYGLEIEREPRLKASLKVLSGDIDGLARGGGVVLFSKQARKLGVTPGDMLTLSALTQRGSHNTIDLKVAAIVDGESANTGRQVLIDLSSARRLFQYEPQAVSQLFVYLSSGSADAERCKTKLLDALEAGGFQLAGKYVDFRFGRIQFESEPWVGQRLQVTQWEDVVTHNQSTLNGFLGLLGFLRIPLVVVVATGLSNSIVLLLEERTREVGTLRSIGLGFFQSVWLFVVEALMLQLIAGAVGVSLGVGACALLDRAGLPVPWSLQVFLGAGDRLKFSVDVLDALKTLGVLVVCMTVAAAITVIRSASLKPLMAMQRTG